MTRSKHRPLWDLIESRLNRRELLKSSVALAAAGRLSLHAHEPPPRSTLGFAEVERGRDETVHVPPGYDARVVVRWGDPIVPGAPPFDPEKPSAAAWSGQFGYSCDFVAYMPLPRGSAASDHGLLCVNNEFSTLPMMVPGLETRKDAAKVTADLIRAEQASVGHSIVEVVRKKGRWTVVSDSSFNRRLTADGPSIRVAGPAAGHPRMKTKADPEGLSVAGTLANCAGGVTPWGTVLSCEENFQTFFGGGERSGTERANDRRYGVAGRSHWGHFDPRFNQSKNRNESNRYGWVVEIDPYDPKSTPVKRTALGRFRHEGATCWLNHDGRVVVYTGDDAPGEYLYRFVTEGRFDPAHREAAKDLLDRGTLSVARFAEGGEVTWLPLVFGAGPLTPENGFGSQADVVIEARRAADQVGATPMDRPEDVETNPTSGRVYVMLTNNVQRGRRFPLDAANPRRVNVHGHVVEIIPPAAEGAPDHAAETMRWGIFIRGGDPKKPADGADYQKSAVSEHGWLSCPDNCTFDRSGRLWIATDGAQGTADGVLACDTEGPGRALTRRFFRAPIGSEVCGPVFTPDQTTLFLAIQHPGAGGKATFSNPRTRWPDFEEGMPPRPSVIAVTRRDGGVVGT